LYDLTKLSFNNWYSCLCWRIAGQFPEELFDKDKLTLWRAAYYSRMGLLDSKIWRALEACWCRGRV